MAWVYIIKGSKKPIWVRPLILDARIAQHRRGHMHTTKRLGETLELVATKEFATLKEARSVGRILKAKKNPILAIYYVQH